MKQKAIFTPLEKALEQTYLIGMQKIYVLLAVVLIGTVVSSLAQRARTTTSTNMTTTTTNTTTKVISPP